VGKLTRDKPLEDEEDFEEVEEEQTAGLGGAFTREVIGRKKDGKG